MKSSHSRSGIERSSEETKYDLKLRFMHIALPSGSADRIMTGESVNSVPALRTRTTADEYGRTLVLNDRIEV